MFILDPSYKKLIDWDNWIVESQQDTVASQDNWYNAIEYHLIYYYLQKPLNQYLCFSDIQGSRSKNLLMFVHKSPHQIEMCLITIKSRAFRFHTATKYVLMVLKH